ncbi:vacuolar protein sorting-associated protein IST1, partial [Lecanoromycetidae sp. Uapishka_2]
MAPSSSLVNKIKVQLKLSITRLRMIQQKDTAIAKQQRRAMAVLLEVDLIRSMHSAQADIMSKQGKEESARIRVENIIRSDINTELLEIIELYCELLLARTGLLEAKECDPGLEEAVKSLIHAAPRTDVKELQQVRQLLVEKYGKDFALEAVENSDGKVAERVLKKLRVEPPDPELVTLYLTEIARTYGVAWPKKEQVAAEENEDDDENPSGGQAVKNLEEPLTTDELSKATPPRDLGPRSPVSVAPPSPSVDNINPRLRLPGPPELKPGVKMGGLKKTPNTDAQSKDTTKKDVVGGKVPDVDELAKRFAALKR